MEKITDNLTTSKLVCVSFFKGERYYFGSLAAIFEAFTEEQVGCSLEYLWNKERFGNDGEVITKTCIISKHPLFRKRHRQPKQ